jgi:hypothetical protein
LYHLSYAAGEQRDKNCIHHMTCEHPGIAATSDDVP